MERQVDTKALTAAIRCAEAAEGCEDKATKDALERASVRYFEKATGLTRKAAGLAPRTL